MPDPLALDDADGTLTVRLTAGDGPPRTVTLDVCEADEALRAAAAPVQDADPAAWYAAVRGWAAAQLGTESVTLKTARALAQAVRRGADAAGKGSAPAGSPTAG